MTAAARTAEQRSRFDLHLRKHLLSHRDSAVGLCVSLAVREATAEGQSAHAIAVSLGLTERTVVRYRRRIRERGGRCV